ncbi:MAG: hypothetical protein ACI8Y7_000974, partial [Candidatus Woesearchaeota archaeon]
TIAESPKKRDANIINADSEAKVHEAINM